MLKKNATRKPQWPFKQREKKMNEILRDTVKESRHVSPTIQKLAEALDSTFIRLISVEHVIKSASTKKQLHINKILRNISMLC